MLHTWQSAQSWRSVSLLCSYSPCGRSKQHAMTLLLLAVGRMHTARPLLLLMRTCSASKGIMAGTMQRASPCLQVTLVVPWLAKCDQELTFINGVTFDTPDEQEKFMGEWITKRTNLTPKYKVVWYSGMSAHLCKHVPQYCELAELHVRGYAQML